MLASDYLGKYGHSLDSKIYKRATNLEKKNNGSLIIDLFSLIQAHDMPRNVCSIRAFRISRNVST